MLASLCSTGCLVTATPEFTEPEQTAPFLVAATVNPRPSELLIVSNDGATYPSVQFTAEVRSEDAGKDVQVALFADYGRTSDFGQPFLANPRFPDVPASTLDDPAIRLARAELGDRFWAGRSGCHSLTMMVTHEFDDVSGCPSDLADSSQMTWLVYVCAVGESCPHPDDDVLGCPNSNDAAELCSGMAGPAEQGTL